MTPKQSELLAFIKSYIGENGYSPNFREIADAVFTRSMGRAHSHVLALEEDGHIRRKPRRNRTIELVESPQEAVIRINADLLAALKNLTSDLDTLFGESDGVAGYHLNDDTANWNEFTEAKDGDPYLRIDKAVAAIAQAEEHLSA